MNTSQYMDKQIMDLSNSQKSNDFIELKNPKDDYHITGDVKKEEILPSYDFQPMRPIGVSPSSNTDPANLAGARVWSSVDSKVNSSIRNYDSLDSIEPGKHVLEKDRNVYDEAFVSEIDQIMKRHADNLLHALDGVSARLSQLETRTRHIENSVDDLKLSIGNNQGTTDGKLRQLEVILREVQTDVEVVKDKQEMVETELNISKLQIPKIYNQPETQTQTAAHVDYPQHQQQYAVPPPASTPLQSQYQSHHHQPSSTYPSTNAPPPPPPLQNHPPPTHQFHPNQIPQRDRDQYHSAPEAPNQPYQALPQPQMYPPPSLPTQPQPQYTQPPPPQPQPPLPHQPEETPYYRQPHSQPPPIGAPPQQFYGPPPPIYEPPPPNKSGYGSSEQFSYGGPLPQYGSGSPRKTQQLSGYPQLPTARILPRAVPAASGTVSGGGGSGSSGTGNRVPIDDVVDRVTNMGFPREQVRATVRKLTENGQAVDLNVVLDKLMNGGGGNNPQSAWFGR